MSDASRISTYAAFWPFYLSQHSKPATRAWHIAGTGVASGLLLAGVFTQKSELFLAAVLAGYGPALISHAFIERNRPATFRYPLWSLLSDFRMAAAWLTGRLDQELEKTSGKRRSSSS